MGRRSGRPFGRSTFRWRCARARRRSGTGRSLATPTRSLSSGRGFICLCCGTSSLRRGDRPPKEDYAAPALLNDEYLPPHLVNSLVVMLVTDLPPDVSVSDIRRYLPRATTAGIAIAVGDEKGEPRSLKDTGGTWLAFRSIADRNQVSMSFINRKKFPGAHHNMWYDLKAGRRSGWRCAEMSDD